jgi:ornithine--oxo-acid transaminase
MSVFRPGDHGSTFGGNPLAAAVGLEALEVLVDEGLVEQSAEKGAWLLAELKRISSPLVREVRGRGLFVGIEMNSARARAREVCERLMSRGLLSKETHDTVVRLAPPLAIPQELLEWAVIQVREVLAEMEQLARAS